MYVCADASRMANDVFKTVTNVVTVDEKFKKNVVRAEAYLAELESNS